MSLDAFGWSGRWQAAFAPYAARGLLAGRIVSEHRTHFDVVTETGEIIAEVPGRLWNSVVERSDMPGVGDFVALGPSDGDGPAIIEAVLARQSALIRQAAGERRPQLIAANVDVVLIVTAFDGDFNAERIARYLAVVRDGGALPVIVINKSDIAAANAGDMPALEGIAADVALHIVSAHEPSDVEMLLQYFEAGRTVALVGSSGVGKSTLTNAFLGQELQAIRAVRARDNRGQHTTTHRQLFIRPGGGVIMDMPGMRSVELWDAEMPPEDDFSAIEALAANCKFRNCRHDGEPACAVRAAIDRGEIDAELLVRYQA